jgi:hypothetical protein
VPEIMQADTLAAIPVQLRRVPVGYDGPDSDLLDLAVMLRRADYAHTTDTLEGAVVAAVPTSH